MMSFAHAATTTARRSRTAGKHAATLRHASGGTWSAAAGVQRLAGNRAFASLMAGPTHLPSRKDSGPAVVPRSVERVLRTGSGQPLDPDTRHEMEGRFAHDFSDVRVHTSNRAARSASDIGADAYAAGRDVVFARDAYAPHTPAGRRLIAHELAHVVQQRGNARTLPARIEPAGSALEHTAAAAAADPARRTGGAVSGGGMSGLGHAASATVCRQIAGRLNFDNLADRVHEAVEGWGTDEEGVYLALQPLQRDPNNIRQLQARYQEKYHSSLEADIRGDFSGEELEYALQLLNLGTPGSAQAVGAAPANESEFEAGARRIWRAVERWGTDEEAIFAVLVPLRRDERRIRRLADAYRRVSNGESLSIRLDEELSGSEYDYANYLLGGPAIQADPEIQSVTMTEATELFRELAAATFITSTGARAPVPFHYPIDGCFDRAYVMSQILTEKGIATEKVFAISQRSGPGSPLGLRVETEFGPDAPAGQAPAVTWWYHVAPIIRVRTQNGVVEMVMDPSTAQGPEPIAQWTGRMAGGAFTRVTLDDIHALLQQHHGYPTGQRLVFTTDRNVYQPPGGEGTPGPREAAQAHARSRPILTEYSRHAPVHKLAGDIRRELQRQPVDPGRIVQVITSASGAVRHALWAAFPNLRAQVHAAVQDPAEILRIEGAVSAP